ncbi:MAG: hypothetical protein R3258_05680 [Acidimicrobiia bacterium]|nr:hypothetical protein [Acidimicrobiia bacterium]
MSDPTTARVVPNLASFSVDRGFAYSIPESLAGSVTVGSIVRVPLSGRRVRGWVVELGVPADRELREISSVSGATSVFDRRLLAALDWAANHYVAPLSVVLAQASPPNLPRRSGSPGQTAPIESTTHPLTEITEAAAKGHRQAAQALIGTWGDLSWLPSLTQLLSAGKTGVVVAATVAEVERIGGALRDLGQDAVVVAGGTDAELTSAWEELQAPGKLLIGTPRVASWQIKDLALAIVLEEGRRAMKERQTPTIHVREMIRKRSLLEGFSTVFFGPTPSVEVLAAGAETTRIGNRAWPLVEVVDRAEDAPGSGFVSERVIAALRSVVKSQGSAFMFTHRRVGLASMRCANCRTMRRCHRCGTRLGRVESCPRCSAPAGVCTNCGGSVFEEMGTVPERLVQEINGRLGGGVSGVYPEGGLVQVGTERDLAGLPQVDLVVAADVDGMLMSHGYRASEEALRQLARLGNSLAPGRGRRMMVQTSQPDSELIATLRRGDPIPYLESVLVERARDGVPPAAEMIALEVRGDVDVDLSAELGDVGCEVMGPLTIEGGKRWLLTGDLAVARRELRPVVGRIRDGGASVRVDADPIDL